jgi:hydrogenase expression/formation protein HypD
MRYIDEFRDKKLVNRAAGMVRMIAPGRSLNLMEVCGTHTQSFFKFGLNKLLPANLNLIAGPGCPVCVSTQDYIDQAINLAGDRKNIILTFGDMLRVPGNRNTLEEEKARGANVHIVYSPLDALVFARHNPGKKIIFLAVGFETTAPTIALSILSARKERLKNLSFFCALKLMPPVMKHMLKDKKLKINGFLLPGHVSSIIGAGAFGFIPEKYAIPCCVAGFEPLDIMEAICLLLKQIAAKKAKIDNQYIRAVTARGNIKAQQIIAKVFTVVDASWRGLGMVPGSGLAVRRDLSRFNTVKAFGLNPVSLLRLPSPKCRCAQVIKGVMRPDKCPLFRKACSPSHPYGPCMVSFEGACNAYFKYN